MPAQRLFIRIGVVGLVFVIGAAAYLFYPWPIPDAQSFELVAHRGVHQTFPLQDLHADTCTATRIYPPTHSYIENTIPSMRAAFANGADTVEIDIHRTADGQLVVFHDWTLDCRTNGTGVTNEQTLDFLRRLDVGYGYTADDGRTFPLRGFGTGLMPTLPEVFAAFPNERFVIHDKDGDTETARLLAEFLGTLPPQRRAQLWYWGPDIAMLRERAPEVQSYIYGGAEVRACLGDYLVRMLMTGTLSDDCRRHVIGIPFDRLSTLPGWPHLILARAHQAGARVFVTDVDTPEQLEAVMHLPLDGIQTNRIEIIGALGTSP
jgi:glycerophosphoryl diester phosphodiesterase